MRTFLLTLLLAGVAGPAVHAADPATDEAMLREIKQVLWPRAYFNQDTKLLDRILAPEFQSVDDEGHWSTKAEEMEWLSKNKPSYEGFEFRIRRLDIFENGTAVVAGTGAIRGRDQGGPYVVEYQSSNIFVKRNGVWQAVASHVSGSKKK